jgi:hypothetical protein
LEKQAESPMHQACAATKEIAYKVLWQGRFWKFSAAIENASGREKIATFLSQTPNSALVN